MRIAFLLGYAAVGHHGTIDAADVFGGRALTGTESHTFTLARGLADRGHNVDVFCPCSKPVGHGNLVILSIDTPLMAPYYDVVISVSEPDLLRTVDDRAFRVNLHELGDFAAAQPGFSDFVDAHVFVSPRALGHVMATTTLSSGKCTWLPNAINLEFFTGEPAPVRRPHSMAWISSADRGLHRLLGMWPAIRDVVPDADLRIYYRFDPWYEAYKDHDSAFGDRARYVHQALQIFGRNGENGVTVVGPVSPKQLARELRETAVLPYTFEPIAFTETFCNAVLDALAAGCQPIISDLDALGDNFGSVARMIPGRPGDNRVDWLDAITDTLIEEPFHVEKRAAFAHAFRRERVAEFWDVFLQANVEDKARTRPLKRWMIAPDMKLFAANGSPNDIAEERHDAIVVAVAATDPGPPVPYSAERLLTPEPPRVGPPLVSVLVPAYRPGGLDITFAALRDQTFKDFEVIIVDQRYEKRHDEVMAAARLYGLDVIHTPEHRRNGEWIVAATAYNTAAALAAGTYIIFLHEWWWAPPDWIEAHLRLLAQDPKAISVTPYTTGEPPALAACRPFDFQAPREMVWEDPKGAVLVPDEVLTSGLLPEVFAFADGPFDPKWIPNLLPITTVSYRPAENWHTDARREMWARGYRPNQSWCVMCNDGIRRELFLELGGFDELSDKSKGIFDGEFSHRLYKVGGQVLYDPACLCVSVRPQRVVRTRPCGGRGARIGTRWSDIDGIAYYDKQRVSPRTHAQNPIDIKDVARRLQFWRAPGAVRIPLDVPDSVYWGRDPLWPEDLPESFFRDP